MRTGICVGLLASVPCVLLSLGVVVWSLRRCSWWEEELMACRAAMTSMGVPEEKIDPEDYAGE